MVLSAVIRTGERFGAAHVINVLRGTANQKVKSWGHQELSVFGVGKSHTIDDLRWAIQAFVATGLIARSEDSFKTVTVTEKGRAFLKSHETLILNKPKADDFVNTTKGVAAKGSQRNREPDEGSDGELFEKLRFLRRSIAEERSKPAYVIFSDATLWDMADRQPESRASFSHVSGVGSVKLEEFADAFMEVIKAHVKQNGPKKVVNAEPKPRSSVYRTKDSPSQPSSTVHRTKELVEQKLSVRDIARQRGLTDNTIISHIARLVVDGETLDLDHMLPPKSQMEKILSAFRQSGGTQLTPVWELLENRHTYEELALARIGLLQQGAIVLEGDGLALA